MPSYYFRVQNGQVDSQQIAEFGSPAEAWHELTQVCAELVASNCRKLQENTDWQMELLDHSKEPVFRIRLVGETLK
jgi:hypothetical protein